MHHIRHARVRNKLRTLGRSIGTQFCVRSIPKIITWAQSNFLFIATLGIRSQCTSLVGSNYVNNRDRPHEITRPHLLTSCGGCDLVVKACKPKKKRYIFYIKLTNQKIIKFNFVLVRDYSGKRLLKRIKSPLMHKLTNQNGYANKRQLKMGNGERN